MRRAFLASTIVMGLFGVVAACGGDDEGSIPDTSDSGPDVTLDTFVPIDTGVDTGIDTGLDAGLTDAIEGGTTLDGGSCGGSAVTIASVSPQFAWVDGKTAITITGSGFVATPKVYLRLTSASDAGADASTTTFTQAQHVAFVSSTSITVVIPAGLVAAGTYELAVVNPNTCAGVLANGIRIVADAPPTVLDVAPASGTTQSDTPVTIKGCHFAGDAKVATVSSAGAITQQTNAAPVCTGPNVAECNDTPYCTITATIGTKTLASGAYAVRVTNTAQTTFGEYSTFVVTNPSGNLTGGWVAEDGLVTGRRSLGVVSGRVNDATRFIYAIGGEDAAGKALKTIEVGPLDRFGQLGKWFEQKNQLASPRSGVAVARYGKWIYALGGTSDQSNGTKGASPSGAPLASIERAKILDPAKAPVVTDPPATDTSGGTLAKGTWYYKVSAIDGDPEDPGGESVESDEVVATLSAAGKVTLTWQAMSGVTGWKVYRSAAADGTSNSEVLLATINSGATTQYVDDGSATPGAEKPMPIGSTGKWQETADAIGNRLNAAAIIAPDPNGDPFVYLLGGWGHCGGGSGNAIVACVEKASIDTSSGALGAFTATTAQLANARMRLAAAVMTKDNGPSAFTDAGTPGSAAFIFVAGGRGAAGAFDNTKNVEYSVVASGGGITTAFASPEGFSNSRDGLQFAIANGYAYAFQGGNPNGANVTYSGTSDQAKASVGSSTITFPTWSNAAANVSKVGRHGVVDESAYFYLVGGTSNDTDALATVYRVLH